MYERTATGTAILDISGATEIAWSLYTRRNDSLTATLAKTLTGSDISLTSDGTDGKFEFELTAANTTDLSGAYWDRTVVTIAAEPYKTVWDASGFEIGT